MTGKLTLSKDYKTPQQLKKEKKARENAEKERIRQEILATEPVNEQDMKEFSGYLADKSESSKSDQEIKSEKEEKRRKINEQRLE